MVKDRVQKRSRGIVGFAILPGSFEHKLSQGVGEAWTVLLIIVRKHAKLAVAPVSSLCSR